MARNPFEEMRRTLERLSEQFERQFEGGEGGETAPAGVSGSAFGTVSVDIAESDDAYEVTADLPGFEPEDIDLSVHDDVLHVEARSESESETEATGAGEGEGEEERSVIRKERSTRSIRRQIRLPGPVDEAGAEAEYQNGVLTVTLPKAEGEETHSIEIR
ncbi:Hsp20/alpha crystallin family protein [Halospeciosus flavus]|uniref:Hsp20/alpha crystallin family protein n=1 Tax=Halospeciosus flavus TaxID=3032283 RepID=A0ABD5Z5S4_9EURY|nr:Hsp20/alpha crystallin family protein [Halospeciosus flavus]